MFRKEEQILNVFIYALISSLISQKFLFVNLSNQVLPNNAWCDGACIDAPVSNRVVSSPSRGRNTAHAALPGPTGRLEMNRG